MTLTDPESQSKACRLPVPSPERLRRHTLLLCALPSCPPDLSPTSTPTPRPPLRQPLPALLQHVSQYSAQTVTGDYDATRLV